MLDQGRRDSTEVFNLADCKATVFVASLCSEAWPALCQTFAVVGKCPLGVGRRRRTIAEEGRFSVPAQTSKLSASEFIRNHRCIRQHLEHYICRCCGGKMLQPNASQSWRHCRFLSLRRAATPVATLAATPATTKRLVNTFLRKVLNHSEKVGDIQTLFKQSNFHGNVHNQPNHTAAPFALDSSDLPEPGASRAQSRRIPNDSFLDLSSSLCSIASESRCSVEVRGWQKTIMICRSGGRNSVQLTIRFGGDQRSIRIGVPENKNHNQANWT